MEPLTRKGLEVPERRRLVFAILLCENHPLGFEEAAACIAVAFPEQLVSASPNEFALRDSFPCETILHEEMTLEWGYRLHIPSRYLVGGPFSLRSHTCLHEGGELWDVHQLPIKKEAPTDWFLSIEGFLLSLIEDIPQREPDLARSCFLYEDPVESTKLVRKWTFIIGPEVKKGIFSRPVPTRILAAGIYTSEGESTDE